MSEVSAELKSLITQTQNISIRIDDLNDDSKKIHKENYRQKNNIEQHIKLLQRKKETIQRHIDSLCCHDWNESDWGLIQCKLCSKLKNKL